MPSFLVRALGERSQLPFIDAELIDAFLSPAAGESEHAILFFTGDPSQRPEADDVAVVLPEILKVFQGRLRGAVVIRAAEEKLKPRFNVVALPSLVVTRGIHPLGVIAKIRDWSDYIDKISAWLEPDAPIMVPSGGPRVEITHAGKEVIR